MIFGILGVGIDLIVKKMIDRQGLARSMQNDGTGICCRATEL